MGQGKHPACLVVQIARKEKVEDITGDGNLDLIATGSRIGNDGWLLKQGLGNGNFGPASFFYSGYELAAPGRSL